MPELGKYEKVPRPESIETFIRYLSTNKVVVDIIHEKDQIIKIKRKSKSEIRVYMTNIYIVSISDIYEILLQARDIDAIVTMSAWNSYTREAKQQCRSRNIGLFKFNEFFGAIYYDGKQFVDYVPPDRC